MQAILYALAVFTYFTIILGSWVRNAGAGLSCPDWPLCHGKIIPPMEYRIMLEYFHRLAASFVGFLLIGALVIAFSQKKYRKRIGPWLLGSFFVLIIQIILGKLTVDKLLQWEVVAMHLGVAVIFLTIVTMAILQCKNLEVNFLSRNSASNRVMPLGYSLLAMVYFQILLGGSVSSHYAGLACPDFPTCHGEWIPGFNGQIAIQFSHRLMALLVTLGLGLLYYFSRMAKITSLIKKMHMVLFLLLLQWTLGIAMILVGVQNNMTIPALASVAHSAVGIGIFLLLVYGVYETKFSHIY